LKPTHAYWWTELHVAVRHLIEALEGATRANSRVQSIIAKASDDGVPLPAQCALFELEPANLEQRIHCLRREAGLTDE
jgi:hypothetical protein